ncbi:MAG: glycosyl hydrolase family 28-related protein, partial [Verrucomicrobia bacterium]|nr:glycosyl hydrolase family 28-related protein [Verrucomicrobiota bacterium]
MQFTRFNIQNAGVGIRCVDTNSSSVSLFQSCTIAAANWAVRHTNNATLTFQNGTFALGGIKFDHAGVLSVLNCDFGATAGNPIELGANVEATLVGNRFVGGSKIANSSTKVVYVDHQPLALDAMPPYEYAKPASAFKPAQTNLYVVTLAPYLAAADGLTDDTAAFQAALSAAATAGGGTVFVPAGGYRLNGNLTIPTGVELRGVYDEPHGTSGRGSILNICGGRNNASGTPFIQIQPSAGVRGLTFHYPEQVYVGNDPLLGMVPYPFTLRGLGSNIYVINVAATIPWQLLDLAAIRCDNHYVDGMVATALKTGVIVGNGSTDGKIMNCQLNPSQYGQSGGIFPSIPTSPYPDLFFLLNTQACGYVLGKTVRQVFHQNFVYAGLSGVLLADEGGSGPHGWSLGLGVDAGNKALQVNRVDAGGFDCINNQLVSLTTQSAYLATSNGFNGRLRLFGLASWGNPAKGAEVNGGELQVQSGLIHHSTALTFDVNNTAKLTWQGGAMVTYATTLVQRDANATANFTGMSINTATTQMPRTGTGRTAIGNLCLSATTPTPPSQPTGLFAATTNALVRLDWNNNSESDLNTYAIYRSTTSGSNYVQIATRLKTSDYSDTNAIAGVAHYYRV